MTVGAKQLTAAVASVVLVLAGCGGNGLTRGGFSPSATTNKPHTYFLASPTLGRFSVIVVSSVAIPTKFFTGLKPVARARGKPRCGTRKVIQGLQGRLAFMNGQLVTVEVNGSSPLLTPLCAHLRKAPFNPSTVATG